MPAASLCMQEDEIEHVASGFGGRVQAGDVHEQVVHGLVDLDATVADKGGKLRVVADAVQERVEEDGFAVGEEWAPAASGEVQWFVPVDIGGNELLEDGDGAVVGGVDGVHGVEPDGGVVGDGETGQAFGVAELSGDDVLEEFGDGLCSGDVAGLGEEFGVAGEELPPALGGLFVPGEDFFGGEDWLGHFGS